MFQQRRISRQKATLALLLTAGFVFVLCLETIMLAKDRQLFGAWQAMAGEGAQLVDYIGALLVRLLITLAFPVTYAIYVFVAQRRGTMPWFAKVAWGLFLAYTALMKVLEGQTGNAFWYVSVALAIGMLLVHLQIDRLEERRRP